MKYGLQGNSSGGRHSNNPIHTDKIPLIHLCNIEKSYGKQKVLAVEDLQICRRDVITIRGPNGAGKTTLLKILAGVSSLSKGKRILSRDLKKLRLCYVPQFGGFYRNLSLLENLEVWCRLYGLRLQPSVMDEWFFKGLGLTPFIHKPLGELSGGFQKIATIACALSVRADGLFLDEPVSGLDQEKEATFLNMLGVISKSAAFVVATSHSATEIPYDSFEIILNEGRIQ